MDVTGDFCLPRVQPQRQPTSRSMQEAMAYVLRTDFDAMACSLCGSRDGSMTVDRMGMATCHGYVS